MNTYVTHALVVGLLISICKDIHGTRAVFWDTDHDFWTLRIYSGGEARLRCVATFEDDFTNHTVRIEKVVKTSEGFTHVTIANRTKVVPPYDQFQNLALQPRYQMQHEQRPNSRVSVLQLYIMGAMGDDGGVFRCVADGNISSTERKLIVMTPVTNVYGLFRNDWGTESSFIDSPQIIWRANSSEGIGCAAFVDGSVDEPEVQVLLGDVHLGPAHTTAVTNQFDEERWLDQSVLAQGYSNVYHHTQLKKRYNLHSPDPRYHHQIISCIAYTNGYESEYMVATYNITVESWPRIICSSHAYFASVGEEVLISCRVDAYPPISFLELVYPDQQGRLTAVTLKDAGTINIPEETAVDDMTVHIDDDEEDRTSIRLLIPYVNEWQLEKYYRLNAENVYGRNGQAISIHVRDNEASATRGHFSTIVLTIIISLLQR